MSFYCCGAFGPDGTRVKTKKQLKELLRDNPHGVYFDGTSLHDRVSGYRGDDIPAGVTLSVVLPDPYKDRRAYAAVEFSHGKLKVT